MKKVVITGPECSGKTTLAKALAKHYRTRWVPEFAREYLSKLDQPYVERDLLEIAKGQLALETEFESTPNTILFYDTDLIVLKIWQQYKYGNCFPELLTLINSRQYDLHLLMKPDIPWVYDSQRENPEDRGKLFEFYKSELNKNHLNYKLISGDSDMRIQRAIEAVDQII